MYMDKLREVLGHANSSSVCVPEIYDVIFKWFGKVPLKSTYFLILKFAM